MGMKPRLQDENKSIDPNLVSHPLRYDGSEEYEHLTPNTNTCKRSEENKQIPGTVTGPKKH